MDTDALTAARQEEWDRLRELSRKRRLSGDEVEELVVRYRAASADLGEIKTSAGRTPTGDHVSSLLAGARLRLTGAPETALRAAGRYFALQLPAALYRLRWTTLAVAVWFVVVAGLTAFWIASDPAVVAALGPRADLQYYAENSFTNYYSDNPAAQFAGQVWTNNAFLAAQCVVLGVTGFWPVQVVMGNAVGVGQAAAVMFTFDRGDVFFLFILPHGLLEMTALFVAAAAGLHIFWAWVAPGARSRGDALAAAGRSLATVALGLVGVLAVSGVIEGFVTRQAWHPAIKIGIGVVALGLFLFYMLFVGGRAARAGETGDLTEYEAGTERLVAG